MTDATDDYSSHATERTVAALQALDKKVTDMRNGRMNDPDSMLDKLVTLALPSLVGMIGGKLFHMMWDASVDARSHGAHAKHAPTADANDTTHSRGLLMTVLFAAASAAFTAALSQLSSAGSRAFIDRKHRRRAEKNARNNRR